MPFLLFYIAIVVLDLVGRYTHQYWLSYICKPLIMILLIGWAWQSSKTNMSRWMLIGMAFALLGDILLMVRSHDLFVWGLAAFLVMQFCYIKVFSADYSSFKLVYVLPFVVFTVVFLTILHPVLSQNIKTTPLWWPVVVYAITISAMGISAVLRKQDGSYQMIVWGAILFIISDATIALSKFVMPFELSSVVIMTTYAASQYLIVSGAIRATKT